MTFHSILAPNNHHLSAIGRVAVQWTFLEKSIETLVWELAPLKQPNAQAVTTHIPTLGLIDTAKALAHERLPATDLEKRLLVLLGHIGNNLRPKRNSVVHGIWGPTASADRIALLETTARGVVKFKVGEEMTAEDIWAVAAEVDQANYDLTQLCFDISSHLKQLTTIHT